MTVACDYLHQHDRHYHLHHHRRPHHYTTYHYHPPPTTHHPPPTTHHRQAFDAFPRFLKSSHMETVIARLQQSGNSEAADAVLNVQQKSNNMLPKDADDWTNMFATAAETFPACIVISDMCIPGAPMIYVNPEFCKVTGYSQQESVGRNCRFLQGPETEVESIAVIRNTLSKGQDCHVKLTNYRKNGEKFQNLLSMKPVFDADGIYRYVIGVQFEVVEDMNLKARLVQLDKLLRLLPSKLPGLRSKAKARAKGNLAARVTGEANELVAKKDAVMKYEQKQAGSDARDGPRLLEGEEEEAPAAATLDYSATIFHFTRLYWLQKPLDSLRGILTDPFGIECCIQFASCACSEVVRHHLLFCVDGLEMQKYDKYNGERDKQLYKLHRQRNKNHLFYCTTTEIEYGRLPYMDWMPVAEEIDTRLEQSLEMLSTQFMPNFCMTKWAKILVEVGRGTGGVVKVLKVDDAKRQHHICCRRCQTPTTPILTPTRTPTIP